MVVQRLDLNWSSRFKGYIYKFTPDMHLQIMSNFLLRFYFGDWCMKKSGIRLLFGVLIQLGCFGGLQAKKLEQILLARQVQGTTQKSNEEREGSERFHVLCV